MPRDLCLSGVDFLGYPWEFLENFGLKLLKCDFSFFFEFFFKKNFVHKIFYSVKFLDFLEFLLRIFRVY